MKLTNGTRLVARTLSTAASFQHTDPAGRAIYYTQLGNRYALSLTPTSADVFGWTASSDPAKAHATFAENTAFVSSLHLFLAANLVQIPSLRSEAHFVRSGWLHVADLRSPPIFGRQGRPRLTPL